MSYTALGEESASEALAKECYNKVKDSDWETKAGRERGTKDAANCAGEGVCAYYTAGASTEYGGGICGTVAEKLAEGVITLWNNIFGDNEELEAYYRRRKETAFMWARMRDVQKFDAVYGSMWTAAASSLVAYAHAHLPAYRARELGALPCKNYPLFGPHPQGGSEYITDADGKPLDGFACSAMNGAGMLLWKHGAATRTVRGVQAPASVFADAEDHLRCNTGTALERARCYEALMLSVADRWTRNLEVAFAKARAQLIAEVAAYRMAQDAGTAQWRARNEAIAAEHRQALAQQRTRVVLGLAILGAGAYGAYKLRGAR
jgi:hypothetical protein